MRRVIVALTLAALLTLALAAPAFAAGKSAGAGNAACDASNGHAAAHADSRTSAINCASGEPPGDDDGGGGGI